MEERTGFRVEFGPVRAEDIPEYLKTRKATPEMRRVRFTLRDRLVLVPVETVHYMIYLLPIVLILYMRGGLFAVAMATTSVLSGAALFPILLPWIPTQDFSSKGFILGVLVMLPFAAAIISGIHEQPIWPMLLAMVSIVMVYSSVTAFIALNFTGSTIFTSRTGVRREIFKYIPIMAVAFISGLALNIIIGFIPTGGA